MMNRYEIEDFLNKRLELLERIEANTKTQQRFVSQRQMIGLRRLLRERDSLIGELAAAIDQGVSLVPKELVEFTEQFQAVKAKEQELLETSNRLLQEALHEKNRVAAELRSLRAGRSLKSRYGGSPVKPGRRLNVKG